MAKGQKKAVLYRVAKFEIHPDKEQLQALTCVSRNLCEVWNQALAERTQSFTVHIAPLYEKLRKASPEDEKAIRKTIKQAFKEHMPTLFDQINALTKKREDEGFALTPRNWQEETLDTLDGAFKSFGILRAQGDPDARPPRERDEKYFAEILGRYGFAAKDGIFALRSKLFSGGALSFPIPEHQRMLLAKALKLKKFTLYRDERDLTKDGRFWVSIAYEIPQPPIKKFVPEEAVYVSVGASSVGIVSPKGAEVIKLWRPDKYWEPKIASVEARMKACPTHSRKWHRLNDARRTMQKLKASQQKQNERELVTRKLLSHGHHFVVTEHVVRSKQGKLADSSKKERGGKLGLNWAAQNVGNLARLVSWLSEKAKEHGGTVQKHKLIRPPTSGKFGHENKIEMAQNLRDSFLKSFSVGIVN